MRDDHCNRSAYILINLIWDHIVYIVYGTWYVLILSQCKLRYFKMNYRTSQLKLLLQLGVMKKAVKWMSTDVDRLEKSSLVDVNHRRSMLRKRRAKLFNWSTSTVEVDGSLFLDRQRAALFHHRIGPKWNKRFFAKLEYAQCRLSHRLGICYVLLFISYW